MPCQQAYQTAASLTIPPGANSLAAAAAAAAPPGAPGTSAAGAAAPGAAGAALNGKQDPAAAAAAAAAAGLADPLGPVNVEKLNGSYVAKHQPALLGTHLFASFLG